MLIGVNANTIGRDGYSKYWGENSYKKAKEFGFDCIDFGLLGASEGTGFYNRFYKGDEKTREEILLLAKKQADEAGVILHQSHAPCIMRGTPMTEEETSTLLSDIQTAIRSCNIIGCKFLVVHPFMVNGWYDRGKPEAEDTFNKNVLYLQKLCDYAKDYDVTICFENMPAHDYSISTPEEVLNVIKKADRENLKMCFDTGHVPAYSLELDVSEEIRRCGEYIKVLHVHDNHGRGDQHNFPGMGEIDWKDVMEALRDVGFDGVFSLELCYPDRFSEPVFEMAARLASLMAKEIVDGVYQ